MTVKMAVKSTFMPQAIKSYSSVTNGTEGKCTVNFMMLHFSMCFKLRETYLFNIKQSTLGSHRRIIMILLP